MMMSVSNNVNKGWFLLKTQIFFIAYSIISYESILDYFLRLLMVGNKDEVNVNNFVG